MKKGNSNFAFKIFLLTSTLFFIYLYVSLMLFFYIPYIDLLILIGFIWAFVEAREGEDGVYRWVTLCGTVLIVMLYITLMHDAWKYGSFVM